MTSKLRTPNTIVATCVVLRDDRFLPGQPTRSFSDWIRGGKDSRPKSRDNSPAVIISEASVNIPAMVTTCTLTGLRYSVGLRYPGAFPRIIRLLFEPVRC